MGVLKKIKGWFTKQSPPISAPTKGLGNLAGLYIPKEGDIKKLSNKVNDLQSAIDNLPPPTPAPDLSEYAKKNENNSFVPQSIVGATPWVNFKFANGKIAGSIQGYDDRFEVKGNYENLVLKSPKNVVLDPTQNAVYEKAPTADNHLVNKKYAYELWENAVNQATQADSIMLDTAKRYTDDEIAKLGGADLSKFYTKDEVDRIVQDYTYTQSNFGDSMQLDVRKFHISNDVFSYYIPNFTLPVPNAIRGRNGWVIIKINGVKNNNTQSWATVSLLCMKWIGRNDANINVIGGTSLSLQDILVGSVGQFRATVSFDAIWLGVK